jgi:tetratricopeptide (TPR) repeat protein
MRFLVSLACALLGGTLMAFGHGALDEQIDSLSALIKQSPSAERYLQRAELRRHHGDLSLALADCERAAELQPGFPPTFLIKAEIEFDAHQLPRARQSVERFLAGQTNHVAALVLRGRILAGQKEFIDAAESFSLAISNAKSPEPDHYIERADALLAASRPVEALKSLDEGIARFGSVVTLQLRAIEIERKSKQYDNALKRVETMLRQSARKDQWLLARAQILEEADRKQRARESWREALLAIDQLPENRRATADTQERAREIHAALARLERELSP